MGEFLEHDNLCAFSGPVRKQMICCIHHRETNHRYHESFPCDILGNLLTVKWCRIRYSQYAHSYSTQCVFLTVKVAQIPCRIAHIWARQVLRYQTLLQTCIAYIKGFLIILNVLIVRVRYCCGCLPSDHGSKRTQVVWKNIGCIFRTFIWTYADPHTNLVHIVFIK